MEVWLIVSALIGVLLVALIVAYVVRRKRAGRAIPLDGAKPVTPLPGETEPVPVPAERAQPAVPGLGQRLAKTRGALLGGLGRFFGREKGLQGPEWEELEEALLAGDVGVATSMKLLERVKGRV